MKKEQINIEKIIEKNIRVVLKNCENNQDAYYVAAYYNDGNYAHIPEYFDDIDEALIFYNKMGKEKRLGYHSVVKEVKQVVNDLNLTDIEKLFELLKNRKNDICAGTRTPITKDMGGELIKFDDFTEQMLHGYVSDYDGVGYYATETEVSELCFKFYDINDRDKLKKYKFTHILWYNK